MDLALFEEGTGRFLQPSPEQMAALSPQEAASVARIAAAAQSSEDAEQDLERLEGELREAIKEHQQAVHAEQHGPRVSFRTIWEESRGRPET